MGKNRLLFLGTGASMGVPVMGCKCSVCLSKDPYNKRFRPSVFIQIQGKNFLIDAGPDIRDQALLYGIDSLDGLILTHIHYDHVGGLDELRAFNFVHKKGIPCLVSQETKKDLEKTKNHMFSFKHATGKPTELSFQELEQPSGKTSFLGVEIAYISFFQREVKVNGFRIKNMAYISDIKSYDPSLFPFLQGVDILVLSVLKETFSPSHFSLEEGVLFAQKVGAKNTYFTHISHELDHQRTSQKLPKGVELAYDGLELFF